MGVGDKFVCYDTHHALEYGVLEVISLEKEMCLVCSGSLGFKYQFMGAVVDTDATGRPAAFHYQNQGRRAH